MSSPFGNLPEELFLLIVDAAVSMFLVKDRATVIGLCQASKAIYHHVAPTLYHTVIVFKHTHSTIEEFTKSQETASHAARVFSHTRSLHVIGFPPPKIPVGLLQSIETIQEPLIMVKAIAAEADRLDADAGISPSTASSCSIRRMHVWYARYQLISQLSARARANITHICGYVSNTATNEDHHGFVNDPAAYIRQIVDALPNLSHLGFDLIYLNGFNNHVVNNWEVQAFQQALCTALAYQRLNVIAIRVSGRFLTRWDEILRMLLEVAGQDPRLQVWKEDNGAVSRDEAHALRVQDAAEGRSIWTEVRPVQKIYSQ